MTQDIDIVDLKKIVTAVRTTHGYDFRNYAMSSFKRRVMRVLDLKKLTIGDLLLRITSQPLFIEEFVGEITVNVTEMFRDPGFWRTLRDKVIPVIYSRKGEIKIWHAGCSSGEEALSMSILLHELGIQKNVSIYATDIDSKVIDRAKGGYVSMKHMDVNEKNYEKIGSPNELRTYYAIDHSKAVFHPNLIKSIKFVKHDLVTGDLPFQFDLILCRNVMIYFNQELQNEVLNKFHKRLNTQGFLAIGSKESLIWCDVASRFDLFSNEDKIYKKVKE